MRSASVFLVLALALATPAQAELDLRRAELGHLPNGLTLILLEDHSFPLVSAQMLYKSGSGDETAGKTGLAHFLEHLAFRASKNFPNAAATEAIYDVGGEWHGYTWLDQTTYFATVPSNKLELLLRIEADRMARVPIDQSSMEIERGAVITELHSYDNDPAATLHDAVAATALQAHPYRNNTIGLESDVRALSADDARAYYGAHYAPANAVLAVVGDFESQRTRAMVAAAFADVAARPMVERAPAVEPAQRGERRTRLIGPVDRQHFEIAFPSPAASSVDFPAYLVLQQLVSGGAGVNFRQSDEGTAAVANSPLAGATSDIETWLPPTRDPYIFTISGSIAAGADEGALEQRVERALASLRDTPVSGARLAKAKASIREELVDNVATTEDAAHQLAFFEGLGALDHLLALPGRIDAVSASDVMRMARVYLAPQRRTVGWLVPGEPTVNLVGIGQPRAAADRRPTQAGPAPAPRPELRRLAGGLPAIVQPNPLSDTVVVALLMSGPVSDGSHPADLAGLDLIQKSGPSRQLDALLADLSRDARSARIAPVEAPSSDPETRLRQLIRSQMISERPRVAKPIAIVASGNLPADRMFASLERHYGATAAAQRTSRRATENSHPDIIRERIARPLAQGAIGYVVEAPAPGSRQGPAWRMMLYILAHDYSGRLGRSAIADKGLVYYISATYPTDGARGWIALATGVDPDKADAMEHELRSQLGQLVTQPPTASEISAARDHLLGRDLTAAQSNDELTAKLARQLVELGRLRSHAELAAALSEVTAADLSAAATAIAHGTIIRVDVGPER
jgi:predicted Zn-dependent peptidase